MFDVEKFLRLACPQFRKFSAQELVKDNLISENFGQIGHNYLDFQVSRAQKTIEKFSDHKRTYRILREKL